MKDYEKPSLEVFNFGTDVRTATDPIIKSNLTTKPGGAETDLGEIVAPDD